MLRSLPRVSFCFKTMFLFFALSVIAVPIFGESYPAYRQDDLLLLEDGKRELKTKGRFSLPKNKSQSSDPNANVVESQTTDSHFYAIGTAFYRGLTQRGGIREEQANKSFSRMILSPETGWVKKGERFYQQILISPYLLYEERINGTKTITKGSDGELLFLTGWESPDFRVGIEVGRGYQRLDRNGFLFVGFLNFGEFLFNWKTTGISFSALGAQMQNSVLYTERNRRESPQRISGGSLSVSENRWIQNFRIFYYLYQESRQESVKGDLFFTSEPFRPYGRYQYYGFEFSSTKWKGIRLDLDGIKVSGFREYGIDAFQSNQTSRTTGGILFGSRLYWERPEAIYFLGGFYTSKDGELRTDRNSNGYAGIRTDPRGYGGKSSFLMMESLLLQEGNVFQEDGSVSKPDFENKGIQLFQMGIRKTWDQKWTLQSMILSSSSSLGRGWEAVGIAGYQSEYSYILMSFSYAAVDPQKEKKVLFDEWRKNEAIKEYSRVYLSAGVYF
ncbi:hypothetical protein AB3N59_11750 [Leptospira sp. WS92.C1]